MNIRPIENQTKKRNTLLMVLKWGNVCMNEYVLWMWIMQYECILSECEMKSFFSSKFYLNEINNYVMGVIMNGNPLS